MTRLLAALAAALLLAPSAALAGDDGPSPFRLALGPATSPGNATADLDQWLGQELEGQVEHCADPIKDWQAPAAAGWAASVKIRSTEKGALYELHWNKGHRLPPKVRKCVGDAIRGITFPTFEGRGYLNVQQVLWIVPRVPGEEAGLRTVPAVDQIPFDDVQRAAAPLLYDIDECMLYAREILGRIPRGQIDVWLTVTDRGEVVALAVAAVNMDWLQRANCVADSLGQMELPARDETDRLRVVQVRVRQVNLWESARSQYEGQLSGHEDSVRLPALSDPNEE